MRAVSLSQDRVIALLNSRFVPVYLANSDYADDGPAPAAEKAELRRIQSEGHARGLSVGSVHAYVIDVDGHPIDSLHTAEAAHADRLLAMLERAVATLKPPAGGPLAAPTPSDAPDAVADDLRLHVVARYLYPKESALVTAEQAGNGEGGSWDAFPGEDWIVLGPERWRDLLPPRGRAIEPGLSWTIDGPLAEALLGRFYPPTENNDPAKDRIREARLEFRVDRVEGGRAVAEIDGRLRMDHPFYHVDDGRTIEAGIVGDLEFPLAGDGVPTLRLVTEGARYLAPDGRSQPFGAALRTVPPG